MHLSQPTPSGNDPRLAPVEPRHAAQFCFVLLTISCALASFALACATPFAAFAVIAAAMLPLRSALLVVTGAWLVNQGIGFGALHYPIDVATMLWGFVIGLAALAATMVSTCILQAMPRAGTPLALALALLRSYAIYEVVLLAATSFLGGGDSFTAAIVGRIGLTNAAWMIGLVGACKMVRLIKPFKHGQAAS